MNMERMRLGTVLIVIVLAIGFSGCSRDEPASEVTPPNSRTTAVEKPTPAPKPSPTQAGRTPTYSAPGPDTNPADELRQDTGLPDFYPKDAPRYPGSTASHSGQLPSGEVAVMFGSEDEVEEVSAFMVDALADEGWQTSEAQPVPDGVMVEGRKGSRNISVMIRRIGDGQSEAVTMIAVVVAQ